MRKKRLQIGAEDWCLHGVFSVQVLAAHRHIIRVLIKHSVGVQHPIDPGEEVGEVGSNAVFPCRDIKIMGSTINEHRRAVFDLICTCMIKVVGPDGFFFFNSRMRIKGFAVRRG